MPRVIPSQEIAYRNDFSLLCNARGLVTAAEIGTDRGYFAADFLSRWDGYHFYAIDPYTPYPEMQHDRVADRYMALHITAPHFRRMRFLSFASPEATRHIEQAHLPLHFIYIDGAHDRESVHVDLEAWWPLLAPQGIMAGHDYDSDHPGVIAAVNAFADRHNLIVRLTKERLASWYVYKQEPQKLIRRYFEQSEINNPFYRPPAPPPAPPATTEDPKE